MLVSVKEIGHFYVFSNMKQQLTPIESVRKLRKHTGKVVPESQDPTPSADVTQQGGIPEFAVTVSFLGSHLKGMHLRPQ